MKNNRLDIANPGLTSLQLLDMYGDAVRKQKRRQAHERLDISDAPGWAIELAARRRELSAQEKAAAIERLQIENHWSQAQVGKLFGVTRAAVSLWLRHADSGYMTRIRASAAAWREQNRYHASTYHPAITSSAWPRMTLIGWN